MHDAMKMADTRPHALLGAYCLARRQTPPPPTFNWRRRRRRKKSIGAPPPNEWRRRRALYATTRLWHRLSLL